MEELRCSQLEASDSSLAFVVRDDKKPTVFPDVAKAEIIAPLARQLLIDGYLPYVGWEHALRA